MGDGSLEIYAELDPPTTTTIEVRSLKIDRWGGRYFIRTYRSVKCSHCGRRKFMRFDMLLQIFRCSWCCGVTTAEAAHRGQRAPRRQER